MTAWEKGSAYLGIRGRLFLALGSIAAMSIAAGTSAWWFSSQSGSVVGQLGTVTVPAITQSLQLARQGTALAARISELASSRTPAELDTRTTELNSILADQVDRVSRLRRLVSDRDALDRIEQQGKAMAETIASLGLLTRQRLTAAQMLSTKVADAIAAYGDLDEFVRPLNEVTLMQVKDRIRGIGQATEQATVLAGAESFANTDMPLMRGLLDIEANGNLVLGAITAGAYLPRGDGYDDLKQKYSWAELAIGKSLDSLKTTGDYAKLKALNDALLDFGRGKNSIFQLHEQQWMLDDRIAAVLPGSKAAVAALVSEIGQVVAIQQAATNAALAKSAGIVNRGLDVQAVLVLVILITSLSIGWLVVGKQVVGRLNGLSRAMRDIAEGNLATLVPAGGGDEIAAMASALTVFRDNALEVGRTAQRTEAERARAMDDRQRLLMGLADTLQASVQAVVSQVSSVAGDVHRGAGTMAQTAGNTRAEASAALSASHIASTNVEAAAAAAEELSASFAEIGRRVTQAAKISRDAASEAERTNKTVAGLTETSHRVGAIVGLIDQIATQTNLLALNATIEAARAGDSGKGFAVVAGEVKNLATQTTKATQEIARQIGDMQTATKDMVVAIQSIGHTIDKIDQIALDITVAVEQQSAATMEISRTVAAAASSTAETVASIRVVDSSALEAGRSATTLLSASADMTGQTQTLQSAVERFLVEVRAA